MSFIRPASFIALSLALGVFAIACPGSEAMAQKSKAAAKIAKHRLAIQVSDNDPKLLNLALNNVANLNSYYKSKGETVQIEVITYGPGLHMLRADTSPVKARISSMSLELPNVTFSACQNTRDNMSKQENKPIDIISEAKTVPSGVVTLLELQEKGFAYIRP